MLLRKMKSAVTRASAAYQDLRFRWLRLRSPDGMVLRDILGYKMYLDLRDQGLSKELVSRGIREDRATYKMMEILKPGQVVVEIGANMGYYALMEGVAIGDTGLIYAIEPVAENVEMLRRNIAVNGLENIEVFPMAVGESDGTMTMYISKKSNWHSFVHNEQALIERQEEIQVVSLDSFLKDKRRPDIVRMDVEGFEGRIVKGMRDLLRSKGPLAMFIEVHPHLMQMSEVVELLESLREEGFSVSHVSKRTVEYDLSLDDLLGDELFLEGKKGGYQIFFERG